MSDRPKKQIKISEMFILPGSSQSKNYFRKEEQNAIDLEEEEYDLKRKIPKTSKEELIETYIEQTLKEKKSDEHVLIKKAETVGKNEKEKELKGEAGQKNDKGFEDSLDKYFSDDESFEKAIIDLEKVEELSNHPCAGASFLDVNVYKIERNSDTEELIEVWDSETVKLASARKNCFRDNITNKLLPKWPLVSKSLKADIQSVDDLKIAICQYNQKYYDEWDFSGLSSFLETQTEDDNCYFFNNLLPKIAKLCLELPKLFPKSLPMFASGKASSLTISQRQAACLLANAFFCTFPRRNSKNDTDYANYPQINFNVLFEAYGRGYPSKMKAKMKCFLNYFERVTSKEKVEDHLITFTRKVLIKSPKWNLSNKKMIKVEARIDGSIEDEGNGMVQIDFANKFIGGGVLGHGSVQEEIRFAICPELIVSCVFMEKMKSNESIEIYGVERFSSYMGYADTFQWKSDFVDQTPIDETNHRRTKVVAIDAIEFKNVRDQFTEEMIQRELNKSFAGFYGNKESKIASGLWGCGVFRGIAELKAIIQAMSASLSGHDLVFFCYGREDVYISIVELNTIIDRFSPTISDMYECLIRFCQSEARSCDSSIIGKRLVEFCQQQLQEKYK